MPSLRARLIGFVATGLIALAARSATYYVSPTGSDSNNGTSQATAWQTITRVNQVSLAAGDRILFQRGGTYRGKLSIMQSGTASNRIEVGFYGSGAKPVISGSVAVTGWVQHSGSIWRAPFNEATKHLYFNGQLMEVARFPNSGWLRMDGGTSTSTTDSDLNQASGYWTGATAVIRTTNWGYDTAFVTGFTGNALTHTATGNNLPGQQWGYFLRNKLELLDAPGEWYLDRAANQLYIWCPGNVNPSTALIEASVLDNGVYVGYQRQHIKIDGLHFKHQNAASLRLAVTTGIEAMNCDFSDVNQAIYSTGNNANFHHLDIQRTYCSGVSLLDNNTTFTHCTMSDIAMVPGYGEQNIGYVGIRMSGSGITIADCRLETIGWSGIAVSSNALVERNVIIGSMSLLNDGAGITFDSTDGAIIRDNIVRDLQGNLESCALGHYNSIPQCHGIYFGNVSNRNVRIERNTVANCNGAGIHVDHTMVLTGVRIENNVLWNNLVQMSISDYSNYNGPGATQPYHVPSFNTVYSGNVMYALNKDQKCMQQLHVYGQQWVDFGTFTNNRYFSPYNDRSIYIRRDATGTHKWFTLERWQAEFNEDASSTRSPLYLPSMVVQEVLTASPVPNGSFGSNVTGWTGWPTQGTITHNTSRLDNGCLKLNFSSNASSNTHNLNHSTAVGIQDGQWYRLRFSVVGDVSGDLTVGFKANSQQSTPYRVGERAFPFDGTRRDVEHFFQSDRTDQGVLMFTSDYTAGVYYLDNIALERVSAVAVNPLERQVILINEAGTATDFPLTGCWSDLSGNLHQGSITVAPHGSIVLVKESDATCLSTAVEEESAASAEGVRAWPNPVERGQAMTVALAGEGAATLRLLNVQGQLVWSGRTAGRLTTIELPADMTSGTYVLHLQQDGRSMQQRVTVL